MAKKHSKELQLLQSIIVAVQLLPDRVRAEITEVISAQVEQDVTGWGSVPGETITVAAAAGLLTSVDKISEPVQAFLENMRDAGFVGKIWDDSVNLASLLSSKPDPWNTFGVLWDEWLAVCENRKSKGSWQTPKEIARFQVYQTHSSLQAQGYSGILDPNVTVVDPCCGVGQYVVTVVEMFGSGWNGTNEPKLVGFELSGTATVVTHLRLLSLGVKSPNIRQGNTLLISPGEVLSC